MPDNGKIVTKVFCHALIVLIAKGVHALEDSSRPMDESGLPALRYPYFAAGTA